MAPLTPFPDLQAPNSPMTLQDAEQATKVAPAPLSASSSSSSSSPSPFKADWRHRDVAVLVSDLSGFTSTTRKHGIVHFASVIVRMRQLVLPIFIERYQALEITTEADNFITVFPSAAAAVGAAVEMRGILRRYNESLLQQQQQKKKKGHHRNHFAVKLNGIGIACGKGVLMDSCNRLHGAVFRQAYHLGEDVCEDGDILVTSAVVDHLVRNDDNAGGATLATQIGLDPFPLANDIEFGTTTTTTTNSTTTTNRVFRVDARKIPLEAQLVDFHDVTYIPKAFAEFAARHDPNADLAALDAFIMERYSQTHTVMMHHLSSTSTASSSPQDDDPPHDSSPSSSSNSEHADTLRSVKAMERALSVLRPIIAKRNGTECEEELFLFQDPKDAVLAVLEAKEAIAQYNESIIAITNDEHDDNENNDEHNDNDENDPISIEGWGIHTGTMIVVPGTDIHWGDPVNTASKLGQDLARNSDLLISESIYDSCLLQQQQQEEGCSNNNKSNNNEFENVRFTRKELRYSGVDFTAFEVSREQKI